MRIELLNPEKAVIIGAPAAERIELDKKHNLLLRLLVLREDDYPTTGDLAKVLTVQDPAHSLLRLRAKLGDSREGGAEGPYRLIRTRDNGSYEFVGEHEVDVFEARNRIREAERATADRDVFTLSADEAERLASQLSDLASDWRSNPATPLGLSEDRRGRDLVYEFEQLRASLVRLACMGFVRIGTTESLRRARAILERFTRAARRDLLVRAGRGPLSEDADEEIDVEDWTEDEPTDDVWLLLILTYYRSSQKARAEELLHLLENKADREDAYLAEPLKNLWGRIKRQDPTLLTAAGSQADAGPGARRPQVTPRLKRYLIRVAQENDRLRFGDPLRESLDADEGTPLGVMSLRSVYTPLRVSYEPASAGIAFDQPKEEEAGVIDALLQPDYRAAVLLGDPGSGKSTVVSFLAVELARAPFENPGDPDIIGAITVPIHVRLADVSIESRSVEDIWSGVREVHRLQDQAIDNELVAELGAWLASGDAVLLLDGLDEVSDQVVPDVLSLISTLRADYGRSRLYVTCRTYDYGLVEPSRRLSFPTLRLLPFRLEDMLLYVDQWYHHLGKAQGNLRVAEEKRLNLQGTLRSDEQLQKLGEAPLLLTLMALVHTNEGDLPRARAVLYHRAVQYLLAETPAWRRESIGATIATSEVVELATRVGHEMHVLEEGNTRQDFRGLTIKQIEDVVAAHFGLAEQTDIYRYRLIKDRVDRHRDRLLLSNGLLLDQGGGGFAFAHRALQEFLAGLYYADGAEDDEVRELARRPHWREPLVLMAGYGAHGGNSLLALVTLIDELTAVDPTDPSFVLGDILIAGEMLAAIGREVLSRRRFIRVFNTDNSNGIRKVGTGLWHRTTKLLLDIAEDPDTPMSERLQALWILGDLGDPRLVDESGAVRATSDHVVMISEGSVTVGREPSLVARSAKAASTEPKRVLTFEGYQVGSFPVTNVEFAEFMLAGGYDQLEYWDTNESRAWLRGDSDFAEYLFETAKGTAKRDFDKELRLGIYHSFDALLVDLRRMCVSRRAPFYWGHPRFRHPNQPVVGINWWETHAYTRWLTGMGHEQGWLPSEWVVRLPMEWEWERAAVGSSDGSRFPWGSEPLFVDDQASPSSYPAVSEHGREWAHTRFDGLRVGLDRATPVGGFPQGTWSGGPQDMAGNVWEWTASRNVSFDEAEDQFRDDSSQVVERIVRGGSWYTEEPGAFECAFRGFDYPMNVYFDLGFRVLLGPANPTYWHDRA